MVKVSSYSNHIFIFPPLFKIHTNVSNECVCVRVREWEWEYRHTFIITILSLSVFNYKITDFGSCVRFVRVFFFSLFRQFLNNSSCSLYRMFALSHLYMLSFSSMRLTKILNAIDRERRVNYKFYPSIQDVHRDRLLCHCFRFFLIIVGCCRCCHYCCCSCCCGYSKFFV